MKKLELLAPVGDMERLKTAVYFGADAVYLAGKRFGLRAFSANFDENGLKEAVSFAHENHVKVYVTVNILAHNPDFDGLIDYLKFLESINVDGVIVSDLGIANCVKENTNLELHVSTQANITNKYSAQQWIKMGAKRLVLARELSINEIKEIKDSIGNDIDIECFCHGAMCISYSGRCLLSNYLVGRDSNKGACVQACRWNYLVRPNNEQNSELDEEYPMQEDERGTYILNSRDLCLIEHIKELAEAGITSFKIEGRMKTPYYVGTTVNAYRRAIDAYMNNEKPSFNYVEELEKTSHRLFTTGFYFGSDQKTNTKSATPVSSFEFVAVALEDTKDGKVLVEMRNKFKVGDDLEVLSPHNTFNKIIKIASIETKQGISLEVVDRVQQKVYINTDGLDIKKNDILRRKFDK